MQPHSSEPTNARERVRKQAEIRALMEAKRVTWKQLAEAADEYTEWQEFSLWLRAVVDIAGQLSPTAALEIERRSSELLRLVTSSMGNGEHRCGMSVWECVNQWAEENVFGRASRESWLNAVRYFSSKSVRCLQAWSLWEDVDRQWCAGMPVSVQTYQQWRNEVAAVSRLSNTNCEAQHALDSVCVMSEPKWHDLSRHFLDFTAFCLWLEVALDEGGLAVDLAARELASRYPGFDHSGARGSKATIRALNHWVLTNEPPFADAQTARRGLKYFVKCHPAYYAMRNYALYCHHPWREGPSKPLPRFDEWKRAASDHIEL